MKTRYEGNGHGIARDGSKFNPPIPTGAKVSWKRLPEPLVSSDGSKTGTHVLAVWSHHDQLDVPPEVIRDTPRGPCVPFYADAEAIRQLVESEAPAPNWIDAEEDTAAALARCLRAAHRRAERPGFGGRETGGARAWLEAAVWTYRQATGAWPILNIDVDVVLVSERFPNEIIQREAHRVFHLAEQAIARQDASQRAANRLRTA